MKNEKREGCDHPQLRMSVSYPENLKRTFKKFEQFVKSRSFFWKKPSSGPPFSSVSASFFILASIRPRQAAGAPLSFEGARSSHRNREPAGRILFRQGLVVRHQASHSALCSSHHAGNAGSLGERVGAR